MHRPTSALHVETMLRRHVYPYFGDRPLTSLAPSEVQAWVKQLSASLRPSMVKVVHGIVASIYRAAIRDRRVTSSPCDGTKLPKVEPHQVEPLWTEQVAALPERFRALAILGAGSGLRQGKAFGPVGGSCGLPAA
jgi:hypothetical protein